MQLSDTQQCLTLLNKWYKNDTLNPANGGLQNLLDLILLHQKIRQIIVFIHFLKIIL